MSDKMMPGQPSNHESSAGKKALLFLVLFMLVGIYPMYSLTRTYAVPAEALESTRSVSLPMRSSLVDERDPQQNVLDASNPLPSRSNSSAATTTTASAAAAAAAAGNIDLETSHEAADAIKSNTLQKEGASSVPLKETLLRGTLAPAPGTTATSALANADQTLKWDNLNDDIMQKIVCNTESTGKKAYEWDQLCNGGLVLALNRALRDHGSAHIVQIGAHIGFEINDPLARGMMRYLNLLTAEQRQRVHWTFVEPSPPNFQRLSTNLQQPEKQALCNIHLINAAVMSDTTTDEELQGLTFYSISETIDPETGFDSKSGMTFPVWITQISGFTMDPINFNRGVWHRKKLNMQDYIVQSKVTTKRFSDLMKDIMMSSDNSASAESALGDKHDQKPVLVLIDTEGFDCDIVLGVGQESPYWPSHLVFEQHQCKDGKTDRVFDYLRAPPLEYLVYPVPNNGQNAVAVRKADPT